MPRCAGGVVSAEAAYGALELLEVDERGLDRLDRELLKAICLKFDGGPVGLSTLAIAVGEEHDTIEDVYEPYLLQQGLIKRTARGRTATLAAFEHLGLQPPAPRRARPDCSDRPSEAPIVSTQVPVASMRATAHIAFTHR